jgi:hypothetical protein
LRLRDQASPRLRARAAPRRACSEQS